MISCIPINIGQLLCHKENDKLFMFSMIIYCPTLSDIRFVIYNCCLFLDSNLSSHILIEL